MFLHALDRVPRGYSEGQFRDCAYGVTLDVAAGGRRRRLYAEQLGGNDTVSFNLYRLRDGTTRLRPCEMPAAKVIDFVLGYRPRAPS